MLKGSQESMQLYSRMVLSCYLWRRYKAVGPGTQFKLASDYFPSRPLLATTMEVNRKANLHHLENPSCRQTTEASSDVHDLSHTVLQVSNTHTSTRPAFLSSPPTSLTEFSSQTAADRCMPYNKLDQTLYNFHMYVWDCSEHQQHQPGYKMVCCHQDSQTDQAQIQHTEHYPGRLVHFLDHRKH